MSQSLAKLTEGVGGRSQFLQGKIMKKRYPTLRPPSPSLNQNLSLYVVRHTRAPQVNSSAPSHCNPPPRAPSQSTHPIPSVTHALAHTHTHTHTNTHTHSDAVSTRSIAPSVGSYATARAAPTFSCLSSHPMQACSYASSSDASLKTIPNV